MIGYESHIDILVAHYRRIGTESSNTDRIKPILEALTAGTFDFSLPVLQMEMIDIALSHYFGRADWLTAKLLLQSRI